MIFWPFSRRCGEAKSADENSFDKSFWTLLKTSSRASCSKVLALYGLVYNNARTMKFGPLFK